MTVHKHAELIKAKADNMSLVLFFKDDAMEWRKVDSQNVFPTSDSPHVEYFLCHPKHADVCLHWLNGGEVEYFDTGEWSDAITKYDFGKWRSAHFFMLEDERARIKPRKEKRWIAVNAETGQVSSTFTTKMMAVTMIPDEDGLWQLIQIEVEV